MPTPPLLPPLLAAASLLLAPAGAPPSAPDDLREAYDVLRYTLDLDVDPDTKTLSGSVTFEARVVAPSLERFQLDLAAALEVQRVVYQGDEIAHVHEGDGVTCDLPRPAGEGEVIELTVHYRGQPKGRGFSGFHWASTADGRPWINTSCQGPGAHSWWPCKASFYHPEDKPEGVRVRITAPQGLYAVSNGRLAGIAEHEDGRRTFDWVHEYPLETYTVTLNVAPYVVVESELELPGHEEPVPFLYYVLPENEQKAAVQFAQVPELLTIYCEAFGPFPFPDSKFGLVETNFWGMEHSTAVAYGSSYPAWCQANGQQDRYAARNRYFDYILVHEVAHEWWGNAVSASEWGHFWIHEGFGTYAEGVYVERTQGRAVADRYFAEQARRVGPRSRLYRGDDKNSREAYATVIYYKGACVLNTLRHYVDDDEAWWKALREFNLRFRYGNADSEDFRAVLEEVTGRGWERFFAEWVYGEGYPELKGSVSAKGRAIAVDVTSAGSGANGFHVPLDLRWKEGGEVRTRRLTVPPEGLREQIACAARPEELEVVHLERVLGLHDVRVE